MKELVDKILDLDAKHELRIRQVKVTTIVSTTPPIVSADTGRGNIVAKILCMDHVKPVVGIGLWVLDMGSGRWLGLGTQSG